MQHYRNQIRKVEEYLKKNGSDKQSSSKGFMKKSDASAKENKDQQDAIAVIAEFVRGIRNARKAKQ